MMVTYMTIKRHDMICMPPYQDTLNSQGSPKGIPYGHMSSHAKPEGVICYEEVRTCALLQASQRSELH